MQQHSHGPAALASIRYRATATRNIGITCHEAEGILAARQVCGYRSYQQPPNAFRVPFTAVMAAGLQKPAGNRLTGLREARSRLGWPPVALSLGISVSAM